MGKGKKSSLVEEALKEAREYYMKNGFGITLRGLYYILMSKGVIPGTKSAYKQLSAVLAEARYKGEFPWYLIRDVTRRYTWLEKSSYYPTKTLSAEELKKILEDYINSYTDYSINPWDDQPKRIIVIIEKEALYDAVISVIREVFPFGVYKVIATKGYDSATNVKEIADDVKQIHRYGKKAVLLALGDFDPSGEDIPRDAYERIKMLSGTDFEFEKVAVRKEHVISLGLPPAPESQEEIEKLKRDPRYPKYLEKLMSDPELKEMAERYGGLVRVELDALVALRLDVFKSIVKEAIEKHFDKEIYEKVTKEREKQVAEKSKEIREKTYEELKKLLQQS